RSDRWVSVNVLVDDVADVRNGFLDTINGCLTSILCRLSDKRRGLVKTLSDTLSRIVTDLHHLPRRRLDLQLLLDGIHHEACELLHLLLELLLLRLEPLNEACCSIHTRLIQCGRSLLTDLGGRLIEGGTTAVKLLDLALTTSQ